MRAVGSGRNPAHTQPVGEQNTGTVSVGVAGQHAALWMLRRSFEYFTDSKVTAGTDNHQRVTPKPRDCQPTPTRRTP